MAMKSPEDLPRMVEIDRDILLLFTSFGTGKYDRIALPPTTVYHNLSLNDLTERPRRSIDHRLSELEDMGFLSDTDSTPGSYYQITDYGVRFVNGELTTEELPSTD